jgi:hypothetical protein
VAFRASPDEFFSFFRANLPEYRPLLLATSVKEAGNRLYKRCPAPFIEVVFKFLNW